MTKLALIYLQRRNPFGEKFRLILQVHDEILSECTDDIKEEATKFVESCMLEAEAFFIKIVPCAVDCKAEKYWVH